MRAAYQASLLAAALILAAPPASGKTPEIDLQEWEVHIASLKRLLEHEPGNPNHYLRVAQAYSAIGDSRQVIDYARMAQERGAHPAQAYLLLGDHYLTMHRFERALRSYDRALRSAPRSAGAWAKAWRALYELRRSGERTDVDIGMFAADLQSRGYYFPKAWREQGLVPNENPAEARRLTAVGYRLLDSKDMSGAIRAFRRALDSEPTFADAFRGLGIAHARAKRLEQALGAYTLFTELAEPVHRDIPKIRGIILDYYEAMSRQQR